MLSPKIAQNFARALSYFEVRGLDDWAELVSAELDSAVQKCATHSCLRCAHACITVDVWLGHAPGADLKKPPSEQAVAIFHRGCARYVRLTPSREGAEDFSLADEYFFCPWEERIEAEAVVGDSDE